MIDRNIQRRQWLIGSAGVIGLATLGAPAFARDDSTAQKNADQALTPAEILSRNDGLLQRVMLVYETAIRRAGEGEDIDPKVFTTCAETTRDFIHKYDEKAKQDLVYPVFKKAGRMVDLVDALIAQQAEGAQLTDRIVDAAPKIHSKEQRDAMAADIKSFIAIYRPAVAREQTDLFPTIHTLVTPDDYRAMATALLKRQAEAFSQDGFEAATKKIADIETKIGTHDLAQAPPAKK